MKDAFTGDNFTVSLVEEEVRGVRQQFEVVRRSEVVLGIPIDENTGNILLTRQYRVAIGRETLEFPAGKVEKDEDLPAAVLRELDEELGFSGSTPRLLGRLLTAPHFSDEEIFCFLVRGSVKGNPHPTEKEAIFGLRSYTMDDLMREAGGAIDDSKTLAAILLLLQIQGD